MLMEAVEIDIVILRSAEFHELQHLTFFSHIVDIDQLRAFFREFGAQALDQGRCRIHGGKARDRSFHRFSSDFYGILRRNSSSGRSGDDIVHLSAFEKRDAVIVRFVNLVHMIDCHACIFENVRRAFRRVK